ncbi:ABC transporter permease [Listeria sp. ILCC792]|uniref:ABC transporter permease n=1 Tax=Listeria sp. ILCC792 TaxID=1918331 RepID=UPI000B5937CA|nr:ABC transporter permease [Listeria sp. ILCC792]
MNRKLVVRLFRKKTYQSLKLSQIVFVFSLLIISCILLYLANQYFQINRDYLKNNNVKVIEILSKNQNNITEEAVRSDVDEINEVFKEKKIKQKGTAYPVYGLKIGIDVSGDEKPVFVTGIDEKLDFLIGKKIDLKNGTMAVEKAENATLELQVPIIEEKNGGLSSNDSRALKYKALQGAKSDNSLFINSTPFNRSYVNLDEFDRLLKVIYAKSENDMAYNKEQNLEKIIVYVNDATDVDQMGEVLKNMGYNTSYAFSNFSNFTNNLRAGEILLFIIGSIILIASIVSIIFLTFNFLNSNKKEMSILKLMEYKNNIISHIYLDIISRNYGIGLIVSSVIFIMLSLLPLFVVPSFVVISIIAVDIYIYGLIIMIVYWGKIKRLANTDLLVLMKKDREFD